VFKKGFSALLRGVEAVLEGLGTKSPTVIALGGHPETHILGETFYSQAPLRWGDYVAKVAVAPVSPELTALTGAALNVNGQPNGLREAVAAFFAAQAGVWEIWAQLLTNCETMPVEDASVPWPEAESPYRPLWRASPCRVRRPGATRRRGLAMTASSSVLGTTSPPIVRSAQSCARAEWSIPARPASGPSTTAARSTSRAARPHSGSGCLHGHARGPRPIRADPV
jgi:hypothetical protein